MKKFYAIFVVAMLLVSCSQNYKELKLSTETQKEVKMTQEERARKVVMDMLNRIDPQTRGSVRRIASVDFISFEQMFGGKSRTESDSIYWDPNPTRQPGFIIVDFEDSTGYAILTPVPGALEEFPGIEDEENGDSEAVGLLAITDSGNLTTEEVLSYGDEWTNNSGGNDASTSYTYAYDDVSGDFLIGETDPDEFVSRVLYAYALNSANVPETDEDSEEYEEIDNSALDQKGPLLKTKWRQKNPFNYYIHTYNSNGDKRPVGCVTVATAQLLTYFKDVSLANNFEITSSSWTQIENEQYAVNEIPQNSIQFDAARMMKKIADGIGVMYNYGGKGGTFATPKMAQEYLEDDLGYNIDRQVGGRKVKRLKNIVNSLNVNKPVFMAAVGGLTDGHAWVVDGYMKNDNSNKPRRDYYIHCNFGWGGNNNGWYLIYALNSDENDDSLLDPNASEQYMKYTWVYRYLFF